VHFSHFFNLIQVDYETAFIGVVLLDAFPAEDGQVVGTVEVLDALVMLVAKQAVDALLVLKVDVSQDTVPLHDLVEDIEVKGQFVNAFDLLDQLAADGAPDSKVVVQLREALCAKGVAAVDHYPGDSFTHVELFCTIVAEVESAHLVVGLDQLDGVLLAELLLVTLLLFNALLLEG